MGIPNRGEMEGKFEQTKGRVKETVGVATDDERLEAEGEADQARGNLREGAHKIKRKIGETVEDVGDAIQR